MSNWPRIQSGKSIRDRIGNAYAGAAGKSHPKVEVGRERGLRDIHARNFVEEYPGVDDLLAAREAAAADVEDGARGNLGAVGTAHGYELYRGGFEFGPMKPAHPERLLTAAISREPQRTVQSRDGVIGTV